MKYFGVILLLAVSAGGEPPVGGYTGRLARLDAAPYDPAGFKPSVPFNLPSRQQQSPNYLPPQVFNARNPNNGASEFGTVPQQYGPPQKTYGSPEAEYTPQQQQYNPSFQQQQQQYNPSFQQQQQQYNPSFQQQQQYNPSFQQRQQQYQPPQQNYGTPQVQYNSFQHSQQQYRPNQQYGAPVEQYGPPDPEYGPPEAVTESEKEITTTEEPTTTESSTEFEGEQLKDEENTADDSEKQQGIYYIYHPSGALQRILFATSNDLENMAYTAQFKYQDVEPIRDPIFTYDPQTLQLRQLSA